MVSERMKAMTTGVMSVELAMRRDIAYMQKIEKLEMELLQQFRSSEKDYTPMSPPMPMPIQVPVQHELPMPPSKSCLGQADPLNPPPYQSPRIALRQPVPTSSTGPFAKPGVNAYLSGKQMPGASSGLRLNSLKRKEPPNSYKYFQSKNYSFLDMYLCKICDLDCTTSWNLQLHRMGQKHKTRVRELGIQVKEPFIQTNDLIRCQLCDIVCMNEYSWKEHLEGKVHTFNLENKISELEAASSSKEQISQAVEESMGFRYGHKHAA